MDKASQKVTKDKDAKLVDAGLKGRENFMKKMKENILSNAKKGGRDTTSSSNKTTSPTINASNEATSATNNASNDTTSVTNAATTRSNDTYVYGVGIIDELAIGVCILLAYNTPQPKNKKQANEKKEQPPKRRHML